MKMDIKEYKKHTWTLIKEEELGYGCIDCDAFISQKEHIELRKYK